MRSDGLRPAERVISGLRPGRLDATVSPGPTHSPDPSRRCPHA
ncbi:MAG: hypothetical protein AVDCRST_MAG64-404 [uncultured Phycisphaerae bacterium]|uniref:Uncharacterized protein n=1 Tax=uncultured Phycisphaerae bacterium TaxID=904963 RepID=A0A6J4N8B9_9BACT|nr:MAG: hypothetical protein AVDCRST_MAG64-404 [uncultured Phycisphaerae bacterium]